MIQVRNVPDKVHRTLKMRAAAAGMSLSDYIKRDLVQTASGPSIEEIDARVRARGPSRVRARTIVEALREVREG
jgi:plasmid stability protein